jgi:hypothetical protein
VHCTHSLAKSFDENDLGGIKSILEMDKELIRRSDAVYVPFSYGSSEGTAEEVSFAISIGKTLLTTPMAMESWIHEMRMEK